MRFISQILVVLLLFTNPAQANLEAFNLPADLAEDMVRQGMARWDTVNIPPGESFTAPRPLLCEGCGGAYVPPSVDAEHITCTNCTHPRTTNTREFILPKKLLRTRSDGTIVMKIFVPTEEGATRLTNSANRNAVTAQLARLAEYDLVSCTSCGRQNNPGVRMQCYGCGTPIEDEQLERAERSQPRTIVGDEDMPARNSTSRSLRGGVSHLAMGTQAPRTAPLQNRVDEPETRPADTRWGRAGANSRLRIPTIPRGALIGGVSAVAVVGIGITIGIMATRDDVHVSRGRVIVVSDEEVQIDVPGFPENIVLHYNPDPDYDSPHYTRDTLEQYMEVDTVDIWWSRRDGVIQILPLDLLSDVQTVVGGE